MALTLLPEEILEQILEYFNIKDLLACSGVCLEWRDKFNVDVFWKRFCIKEITEYLEKNDCKIKPIFVSPDQYEERLQPMCRWRINFMRQIHLLNNWKSKKLFATEFRTCNGVVSCDLKLDSDGIHWLFVRTVSEIEIWNIHSDPQLLITVPIFVNCFNVNVFIAEKRAIITQWNVVSVYDLRCSKDSFKTQFRFVLEEEEVLPVSFWDTTSKSDIRLINEDDDFRFINFGSLIVGHKRIPNPQIDSSMHFWNSITGKKYKIESISDSLCDEHEIAFTNIFKIDDIKGLIRLVFRSSENALYSIMHVYDFKKQKFTNTIITVPGVVVWCGCAHNIIVTFSPQPGTIKFYNYSSGKLFAVKEIGEYTNSEQMQLIDSYLLFCMFNCMNVINIHNQEVVYCLQFSFYSFVRRLTAIGPRFVVVWLLERGKSPGCPSYLQEVWDLKDLSNKLLACSSNLGLEMVTNSSSLLKQVINFNEKMCVYTFW